MKRCRAGRTYLILGALVLLAPALMGPTFVQVYNGPGQVIGDTTYYNATNLGLNMSVINVILSSDATTTIAEDVDVSNGGAANRNLVLRALGGVGFDHDLTMGLGNIILETELVNLIGVAYGFDGVDTILLPASRLAGCSHSTQLAQCTTTHVNVLGAGALIEQGLAFSTTDGSMEVFDGLLLSDLGVTGSRAVSIYGGTLGGGLFAGAASVIRLFGSGFELDAGAGFQPVGSGALGALSGTLRGTLQSGDVFETSFGQGGGPFTGSIILVPEPATAVLLGLGLGGIAALRRSRRRGPALMVAGAGAVVAAAIGAAPADAALDQSFLSPGLEGAQATAVHSNADLAQTFTVGLTGTLSQVDLLLESGTRNPTAPLIVEIRETVLGVPTETVLGDVSAAVTPMGADEIFVSFDLLSQGIEVSAGQVLAIVLRSSQIQSAGAFFWVYDNPVAGYAGGSGFRRSPVTAPWNLLPVGQGSPAADFGFRTFVVPEPATGALLACGLALLAAGRRVRDQG